MDITDLLHFQAAFQADGVINSPADEENILCINLFGSKPLDPLFIIQNLLDLGRYGLEFPDIAFILFLGNRSSDLRKLDCQHISRDQLGAVCLGGSNGNLRSGKSIEYIVCFPGNRRTYHIYNSQGTDTHLF